MGPDTRPVLLCLTLLALAMLPGCSGYEIKALAQTDGSNVEAGRHLAFAYGCGSCHVIPGIVGAEGALGPSLDSFGQRMYIAGSLPNTPENLERWIMHPQNLEPGTAMPDLGITAGQARNIAAFLNTLR